MIKSTIDIQSPKDLANFMKEHPCKVRYSLTGKLYIGLVDTCNDLFWIHEKDTTDFMDYVRTAHHYATEYTATINNIHRRGVRYATV